MSQPTPYTRQYSFTDYQASTPSDPLPANQVDAELNAAKTTIDEILANLAIIQRDDTKLANGSVHIDALSADVKALLATTSATLKGAWATATVYALGDIVSESGALYMCVEAYTSGTFATDLAADKWVALAVNAAEMVFTPAGSIAATDVQAAIEELDTEKQPLDALLTALAALTTAANKGLYFTGADTPATFDLTAAGLALLDDASASAQRATLVAAGTGDENTFTKIQTWSKGADVASAAPLVLGDDGNYFDITGTTGFGSISTKGVGTVSKLHFDGALTMTHSAALVLPGAANITTAAGDEAEFVEFAIGSWRCTNYTAAAMASIPATQAEMEAGTATNRVVTPAVQHFGRPAAKAWVKFDATGAIRANYNIASLDDDGTGDFGINWNTPFSSVHYVVVSMSLGGALRDVTADAQAAGSVDVVVRNDAGAAADPTSVFLVAFGDF